MLIEALVPFVTVTLPSNPLPQSDTFVKAALTGAAEAAGMKRTDITTAAIAAMATEMRLRFIMLRSVGGT